MVRCDLVHGLQPGPVRTANRPRRSDSQFSLRTRPAFSIRVIWWESRLLDCSVAAARSLIRIRRSGGLGEIDQDLVVVHRQAERLEVVLQLVGQQPVDLQVGAPCALLRARSASEWPSRSHDGFYLRRRIHGRHEYPRLCNCDAGLTPEGRRRSTSHSAASSQPETALELPQPDRALGRGRLLAAGPAPGPCRRARPVPAGTGPSAAPASAPRSTGGEPYPAPRTRTGAPRPSRRPTPVSDRTPPRHPGQIGVVVVVAGRGAVRPADQRLRVHPDRRLHEDHRPVGRGDELPRTDQGQEARHDRLLQGERGLVREQVAGADRQIAVLQVEAS